MRIDAHQHFWRYTAEDYGWIPDTGLALKQDRLPVHLKPLLARTGLDGTIAVQARQSLAETDWLLQLADEHPFIKGVVGWVDLCSSDLRDQLKRYAAHPKFKGVRHVVQDEPDDRFMLRPQFLNGLGQLAEFNLTYDLLIYSKHLSAAAEVVRQFPGQRFILDHIAKPSIRSELFAPWAEELKVLASHSNVHCKVSGLVTEADWETWTMADFRPYLEVVFDCFGSDRLMFGSDWPVCTLAASYAETVLLVLEFAAGRSRAELDKLFGLNALASYGISAE